MLCLGVVLCTVACGNMGGTDDNATNDQNNGVTEGTDRNDTASDDTDRNDNASDDTDRDDNIVEDMGDAVGDGMQDVGDGVKNMTDDATGNN